MGIAGTIVFRSNRVGLCVHLGRYLNNSGCRLALSSQVIKISLLLQYSLIN